MDKREYSRTFKDRKCVKIELILNRIYTADKKTVLYNGSTIPFIFMMDVKENSNNLPPDTPYIDTLIQKRVNRICLD